MATPRRDCKLLTLLVIVTSVFLLGGSAAYPVRGLRSLIPAFILLLLTLAGYAFGLRCSF